MYEYDNITLMRRVLSTLLTVSRRRTSPSFSVAIIDTILKKLEKKYDFLGCIETEDSLYSEEMGDTVHISRKLNHVEPEKIGKAVEEIIWVICMDMKDDAGFYFIKEFKECIGDDYTLELIIRGVNFDSVESNIEKLYLLRKRNKTVPITDVSVEMEKEEQQVVYKSLFGYSWENVATWKYENNICVLYNNGGQVLDRLYLDVIVEDCVRRLSEFDEFLQSRGKAIEISDNEDEFLQLLYSRDMDADFAMMVLHISQQELDAMIRRLLEFEILHYSSAKEVKLTEKGISYLLAKKVIVSREKNGIKQL